MKIPTKKQKRYIQNFHYPIICNKVQKDLDDTDSITFSRLASKRAITMCADRLELILANNPDDFDLEEEISQVYETLRFAEKNLMVARGIEELNGNTPWLCVNYVGMELMFASEPHRINFGWRDNYEGYKCLELPKGSIKKLIGRELSFNDEPVELKEE